MRRPLLKLLTALSLLLCVGVCVLWVRSYRATEDLWLIHYGGGAAHLNVSRGRITVQHTRPDRREPLERKTGITDFIRGPKISVYQAWPVAE
jgi:hypothetical protein